MAVGSGMLTVDLSRELLDELDSLERSFHSWSVEGQRKHKRALGLIGQKWRREAIKRVPRKTGFLANRIVHNVYLDAAGVFVLEMGTNVGEGEKWAYPELLEFGTRRIAGGRVLALGQGPNITDDQAITDWPAKEEDAAAREQMPWIRPSFHAIAGDAIALVNEAYRPPKQKRTRGGGGGLFGGRVGGGGGGGGGPRKRDDRGRFI